MRKIITLLTLIAITMILLSTTASASNTVKATLSESYTMLNGENIWIKGFNINGSNYYKLRDLAQEFSGTGSQFNVQWNSEKSAIEIVTGKQYTSDAQQDNTYYETWLDYYAQPSTSKIVINNKFHDITAYNIDGNTYFQLRDLSKVIPFDLQWDSNKNTILLYSQTHKNENRANMIHNASLNAVNSYYPRWSNTISSYIVNNDDHTISVIEEIHHTEHKGVSIETYDHSFNLIPNKSKQIDMELPIFGGFLKGENHYYIAYGQSNTEENDNKEVIRIVRYDNNFKRIDSVSINGGDSYTTEPFDAGSGRMAENGNTLVFHTSRERYTTEDGLNHQSQLTIIVDTSDMKVINDLGRFQSNHVSHSFDQYVRFDGNSHVLVDHGDAYPRSIVLSKQNGSSYEEVNLFQIPGRTGANMTGVSIGGFESSSDHYLVALNSINHSLVSEYTSYEMVGLKVDQRDIIISSVPKNNLTDHAVKQVTLAQYVGSQRIASIPKLVKITEDQFMVLWQEYDLSTRKKEDLKYVYIDKNGNAATEIQSINYFQLSTVQPILIDNAVVWYTNENNFRMFYTIPLN